jgi:hypothetical protein
MIEDFMNLEKYLINSLKLNVKLISLLFKHPGESRFKDLFDSIKVKKKRKTMSVNPKNIMLGLDKRTSIIIKNIPDNITSNEFKRIIINYCPYIDFFYVPFKIRTRKKLRVAFVNVLNFRQIVPIYMGLIYKMKFVYNSPDIEMEICYSKVQGKNQLIQRFFHEFQFNM